MTSKTVEFAIFWLPLLASVLLGGIAGSAWYGGDKIPAIWIAFFGAVCLLLTITIQAQQYTYANFAPTRNRTDATGTAVNSDLESGHEFFHQLPRGG